MKNHSNHFDVFHRMLMNSASIGLPYYSKNNQRILLYWRKQKETFSWANWTSHLHSFHFLLAPSSCTYCTQSESVSNWQIRSWTKWSEFAILELKLQTMYPLAAGMSVNELVEQWPRNTPTIISRQLAFHCYLPNLCTITYSFYKKGVWNTTPHFFKDPSLLNFLYCTV